MPPFCNDQGLQDLLTWWPHVQSVFLYWPAENHSGVNSAEQPSMDSESAPDMVKQTAMAAEPAQPSAVSPQPAVAPVLPERPTVVAEQVALQADSAPHGASDVISNPAVVVSQPSVTASEAAVVTPGPAVVVSEPAMVAPKAAVVESEPAVVTPEAAVASSESALESVSEVSELVLVGPGAGGVAREDSEKTAQGKQEPQTGEEQLSNAAAAVDAVTPRHATSEGKLCV